MKKYYEKKDFNPGGIPDRVDNRDYQWDEVGGAAVVPFDWAKGFDVEKELEKMLRQPDFKLTVKDQGPSFSCGGQAWGYLAEVLEALSTGTYEPRSAKYMYAQTCVPEGGSRGRDNAEVYKNQGVAKESALTSYQNGTPPSEPFMQRSGDITDMARQDAKLCRASAYAQTGTDMESIAIAIRENFGVVIGVDGANNGTWTSAFPKPPKIVEWRHWVYAGKAKMVNGKKYIGFLNSWGKDVGEDGWQWLEESYFKNNIFSGWTHVFAPVIPQGFKFEFIKDLKYGMHNKDVMALQTALALDGVFPITVPKTGYYGMITTGAVLAFQLKYQIIKNISESDGGKLVGVKTRTKLNQLYNV